MMENHGDKGGETQNLRDKRGQIPLLAWTNDWDCAAYGEAWKCPRLNLEKARHGESHTIEGAQVEPGTRK